MIKSLQEIIKKAVSGLIETALLLF